MGSEPARFDRFTALVIRFRWPLLALVALVTLVLARELPSLDQLLAQLAAPIEEVEFHFSPDRFDVDTRVEPFRYDGDQYMVRGPFAAEHDPFMVAPPARH